MGTSDTRTGEVTTQTRAAENRDAHMAARADRPPTPEEEAMAPAGVSEEVAEQYEEALERGASVKGEGRIEP